MGEKSSLLGTKVLRRWQERMEAKPSTRRKNASETNSQEASNDRQDHYRSFEEQEGDDGDDYVSQEYSWPRRYGEMLLHVSAHLTKEYSVMLATYYSISPHHRQRIENSETPGLTLLHLLEERNIISRNDVSSLTVALVKIDLHTAAQIVNSYTIELRRNVIKGNSVHDLRQTVPPNGDEDDKVVFLVDELRKTYKDMFLARPIPWEEQTPLDGLYIKQELSYIEQKSNIENKLSSYKDLLRQSRWKESKRILLDGRPGMGKTTCMLKIAHDWATGEKPIKNKKFVILLFLRDVVGETPLAQAVVDHLLPNDSNLFVSDVQKLLRKYERNCLLLLDGHDELRTGRHDIRQPKECATIQRVIEGALLRNLSVWMTTRPSSNVEIALPNISSYQRFSLEGFSTRNMEVFISKTFGGNKAASQAIWHYISSNSILSDVCKAPLFLALISQVHYEHISPSSTDSFDAKRNENLSDTLLKLFTAMNTHLEKKCTSCSRSTRGLGEKGPSHNASSIDNRTFQNQLGMIALQGLSRQGPLQLTWNKEEFLDKVGEDVYNTGRDMGVLIEKTITRPIWESFQTYSEEEVTFSHQLYQEWLAARYVASSEMNEGSIFDTLKNVDVLNYKYLLLFVCGMSEALAISIMKYLYVNKLYLLLPECFFQCNTNVSLRSLPIIGVPIVEVDLGGGNYMMQAVIHFLANCSKSKIPVAEMIFKGREFKVKCSSQFLGSECSWYRGVGSLTVAQISFHSLYVKGAVMENILHWTMKQTCRVLRFFDCTLPDSLSNKLLARIRRLNLEGRRESFPVSVYDVTRDCCLNFVTGKWDKISAEKMLKLLAYNSVCRERCLSQGEAFEDFEDLNESLIDG